MCRLLAYSGEPIFLENLLLKTDFSLIAQSQAAREAKTVVNGDGCGIGWYGARDVPGTYRSTLPAWSDGNLSSLCHQLSSAMFVAHIRSATSGDVTRANCHPFTSGPHLFAHNGQIGDYDAIRRRIDALVADQHYHLRRGTSDSEIIFLAALSRGLEHDPVGAISGVLSDIVDIVKDAGMHRAIRFAAIHTNGEQLWAYRWSSDNRDPSLYWNTFHKGVVIASEPFDTTTAWRPIPPATVLHVDVDRSVSMEPLLVGSRMPEALSA